MLYHLHEYADLFPLLNVFRYITFRAGGAIMTSLIIVLMFGPWFINCLKSWNEQGQPIREDGPQSHLKTKKNTPTMGGIMILGAMMFSVFLWTDLNNILIQLLLFVGFSFGAVGLLDDYVKVKSKNSNGITGKIRLISEFMFAFCVSVFIAFATYGKLDGSIYFPFLKDLVIPLGGFFIIFSSLVIVGSANSVNLTDGLDGLAIVPVMIVACCLGLISYLAGNFIFAQYLQLIFVPGAGEISVFAGALVGAGLGFLWYNAPPAQIFMGDTGSLSLGAILGSMAVIIHHEIVLAIVGGLFVIETLSVFIQVISFKLTGKRVFAMAPIHHHFEKKGWSEATIVIRFWIISIVLAFIGLASLKIR